MKELLPAYVHLFASLTALGAALDYKTTLRGGFVGASRNARHIWRMCAPVFIALVPLAFIVFWLVRVRLSRRFARVAA